VTEPSTEPSTGPSTGPWTPPPTAPRTARRTIWVAVALIGVQLGFRAWVTWSSWFTGDDFVFIARMTNDGTSLSTALEPHGGHLMPAGLYLSWLSDALSPYDYRFNALVLLALQAAADLGLLVLLVRMFGARPGILPPLALYLFTVFTVPLAVWWAAGINQFALHAALFWGLVALVTHLRTRGWGSLLAAAAAVVVGLAFYEKTILVLVAYGIVALAYFATGTFGERVGHLWSTYRPGVLLLGGLGAAYVGLYVRSGLNFSPRGAGGDPLGEVISNMTVQSAIPGLVGGPLAWADAEPGALPAVGNLMALASVVVVVLVGREIHLGRLHSLRAWAVPGFFLVADVLLVTAARASLVGPRVALDYRYAAELGAATAIGLALATMPLIGALESSGPRPSVPPDPDRPGDQGHRGHLLGHPDRVAALTAVIAVLGLVSSVQYADRWQDNLRAKDWFGHLLPTLERSKSPVPLVDAVVPDYIVSPLEGPDNLLSHLLVSLRGHVSFPEVATDQLLIADDSGRLRPVGVPPTRSAPPGPQPGCGYAISDADVSIPLDGPISYDGFWVRIGYLSSARSPVVVSAGDSSYSTVLLPGVHALYVRGGGTFESVSISRLSAGVTMCTDDVHVGKPEPITGKEG